MQLLDGLNDFPFDTLYQVFLALCFGGLIGYERERNRKGAGLRTNILICLGSTMITHVSIEFSRHFGFAVSDPSRIAAQIVSGVGFLGAGTILHQAKGNDSMISGLTTAATIWAVAGIGLALGAGFYWDAFIATMGIYICLAIFSRLRPLMHTENPLKDD